MKRRNTVFPGGFPSGREVSPKIVKTATSEDISTSRPSRSPTTDLILPISPPLAPVPRPEVAYASDKDTRVTKKCPSVRFPVRPNASPPVVAIASRLQYAANVQVTMQSPWKFLRPLSKERWASSSVIMAFKDDQIFSIVEAPDERANRKFKRVVNPHVLELFDVYFSQGSLFFVYEYIDVSLRDILVGPQGRFKEHHVASICKEVLLALAYIHDQTGLVHGNVKCDTILITWTGVVKLGNIGQSQLDESSESKQDDILALREVMLEILAPRNSEGQSATSTWSMEAREFFENAANSSAAMLLEETFITRHAQERCLAVPAFLTGRCKFRRWEKVEYHD